MTTAAKPVAIQEGIEGAYRQDQEQDGGGGELNGAAHLRASRPTPLLDVKHLMLYAGDGIEDRLILQDITLQLLPGQWLAIVGINGCGKSTLLRQLAGLGGDAEAEACISRNLPEPYGSRPLPIVLQQPDAALTGATPWEDLVMALEHAGMEGSEIIPRAERTLAELGLAGLMHKPVGSLSGGQKQLVIAAGAISSGSPVMLFDEAASMLDGKSAELLMRQARDLQRRGYAIIWVTQNMAELAAGDSVLALREGRSVWSGAAEDFFRKLLPSGVIPCKLAGLHAPYAVQAAWELYELGYLQGQLPLDAEALAEAWHGSGDGENAIELCSASGPNQASALMAHEQASASKETAHEQASFSEEGLDAAPSRSGRDLVLEDAVPGRAGPGAGRALSAVFRAGKLTLLIGSNGAGKSTLLETAAALRPLAAGRIRYGGDSLWEGRKPNRDVLLSLGISLQQSESQWFARTVLQELRYSVKPYGMEASMQESRIMEAMQAAGLNGELLSRDPWTLSGGEQRRLALACLLAGKPEWLLLDEPAAGLDGAGGDRLKAVLQAHLAAGGGAVAAVHSLDSLLPIAHEVVLMQSGQVIASMPAEDFIRMKATEKDAPQALQAACRLGMTAGGQLPWLSPRELAVRMAGRASRLTDLSSADAGASQARSTGERPVHAAPTDALPDKRHDEAPLGAKAAGAGKPGRQPDPRALIAAYLLICAGILAQKSWLGIAASLALAAAVLIPFRRSLRPFASMIRAYSFLVLTLAVTAGLSVDPLAFHLEPAMTMLQRMLRLLIIMLIGLPLLSLLQPFRVQKAADQLLSPLSRLGVPTSRITLPISLLFRFIPLLAEEWQRYARIGAARGKLAARPGRVPPGMLYKSAVPYMLSILRLGDRAADALEAKGFGAGEGAKSSAFKLAFSRVDGLLIAGGIAVWGVLTFIAAL